MEPQASRYTVFKQPERLSFEDRQALSGIRDAVLAREPVHAGKIAYWWLRKEGWRFSPRRLAERRQESSFDSKYGVETSTRAELPSLTIRGDNRDHGVYYQASPVGQTRRAIRSLNLRFEDYTFIDFGSGKGRVLLVASELPFRKVIGVEFAEELHQACLRNIENYPLQKCGNLAAEYADVASYAIPDENLVIYLFNPFDRAILSKVVANLIAAKAAFGKDVHIVFHHCADRDLFEATDRFECVRDKEKFVTYRMTSVP